MRKALFIVLLLPLPALLFAQKDYKPGYIINNESDTIHGFINLKSNQKNHIQCYFSVDKEEGDERIYTCEDIKAYRIENQKYYISKELEFQDTTQKLFLEYLIDGIVDLYYLKSESSDYYFIEKDDKLVQLNNDEIHTINTYHFVRNTGQYKGVLNFLYIDAPELRKSIETANFDHKSLVKLTEDYHNSVCTDYECINYTKSTKTKLMLEPLLGYNYSMMKDKHHEGRLMDNSFIIGTNLRIKPSKTYYLWNLLTGANLSKNSFAGDYEKVLRFETSYYILHVPITLEFSLPYKLLQPFVSLTYQNAFLFYSQNNAYRIQEMAANTYYLPEDVDPITYHFGGALSLGIRYNQNKNRYYQLSTSYSSIRSSVNTGYVNQYLSFNSLSVCLAYGFALN